MVVLEGPGGSSVGSSSFMTPGDTKEGPLHRSAGLC